MSSLSPQELAALIDDAERALDQLFAKAHALIAHVLSTLERRGHGR